MWIKRIAVFVLVYSGLASAGENFYSNGLAPYPPGCVTYMPLMGLYPGGTDVMIDGPVPLDTLLVNEAASGRIIVKRKSCSEPNRSVIIVEWQIVDNNDGVVDLALIPNMYARIGDRDKPLRVTEEPNSFLDSGMGEFLSEGTTKTYILDGGPDSDPITGDEYNSAFTLIIENFLGKSRYNAHLRALNTDTQPSYIPLNGRLSGIWVVDGAKDQGFVISFSEFLDDKNTGLIFFSWYTFDADGNNVWLVGNARYNNGDSEVTFNVQLVTDGQFLGDKTATRIPAGSIRIKARHCTLLELHYDLRDINLGQGTKGVVRLLNLETAGYTCMDPSTKRGN